MEEQSQSKPDIISHLPDAILQHILSFIPINQAVETTILSKRFHNLWSSMPNLDFNFTLLAIHRGLDINNWKSRQDFSLPFQHLVSHFLSHRDHTSSIHKFHLITTQLTDPPFIQKCTDYAITHGVKSLRLQAHCFQLLKLPESFFASETLLELELRHVFNGVYLPEKVFLPHLKTLFLENSGFFTEDSELYFARSKEPFSGFPQLEKLTLRRCVIHKLTIIGPKLRILEIIQDESYDRVEEIRTPRLTLFRYEGFLPLECSKFDFPILEETYLNIRRLQKLESKWKALRCVRMLEHLGKASIVTFTLDTIKVLEMDRNLIEESPSPFPNMKCLRLRRGRREIPTVQQRVMNYLTGDMCGESLMVEFPEGVSVIEEDCFDEDVDELKLENLFEIEDEM